jgi:RNA polymerase sigma factor (sigma-70 family)
MGVDLEGLAYEHGPALVRFAYLLTGDRDAAQDLTQAVFEKLGRRGSADIEDLPVYARRALVNLHRTEWRRTAVRRRSLVRLAGLADTHPHDRDPVDATYVRDAVGQALGVLPARQRAAIVLRYYEDRDDRQIADLLGCRPATVRSLLARGRAALRSELAGLLEPEDGGDR